MVRACRLATAWGARLVLVPALVGAGSGCTRLTGFSCTDDAQCRRGGELGTCEVPGYCAYPDEACPSGRRFSPDAEGELARECTQPQTSLPGTSTTDGEGSGTSSTSAQGSSSTGEPIGCGNGMVELDELCDDGNDIVADGCNPDCRPSGMLVADFVSGRPGLDFARACVLVDGDVVVAGEAEETEGDRDIFAARFGPDGDPAWVLVHGGSGDSFDRASAALPWPDGTVLVGGEVRPDEAPDPLRADLWFGAIDLQMGTLTWEDLDATASPSHDAASAMVAVPGGILVTGRTGSTTATELLARRLDVAGGVERVWTRVIGGEGNAADQGLAALVDAQGRAIVAGYTRATADDLDRYLHGMSLADGTDLRPPCLDDGSAADGRVLDGRDEIRDLALAPTGEIVAVGLATRTASEGLDAWIGLYDPTGCALVWEKTVAGDAQLDDEANGVIVDDAGAIVTVGALRPVNSADAWVAKWNLDGDLLWQAELVNGTGDDADVARDVAIDADSGELVVVGQQTTPESLDSWIARYTP